MEYELNQIRLNSLIQIKTPDTNWAHIFNDDAADAILMIAKDGLNGKTYSLGSVVGIRIEEFIKES
jgi:hypothetical protein